MEHSDPDLCVNNAMFYVVKWSMPRL